VVASITASANPPSVSITAPGAGTVLPAGPFDVTWVGSDPDGDELSYSVLYSTDGSDWQTLATGLTEPKLTLDTDNLPGGSAMVRVIASDGLLTGEDTSGTFTVPLHAPVIQIIKPDENQIFYPTQQVVLSGTAYDLEDGSLGDAAFHWSSSIDGDLGSGATLNTSELRTGVHTITLTVSDSDGMESQAQRTITISEESAPVTANLEAAPFMVGIVAGFGDPITPYIVTLRTTGGSEVDWTASEDIPWLTLDTSAGTTPSELVLTFDPGLLRIGDNAGKIILTSNQAGNSPLELNVTVQVVGHSIKLPLITR